MSNSVRSLHYVFKVGDRNATAAFYSDILKMKVLRHEEFKAGCEATCNGPYDGKWSKTMVGYGPEDSHFVCELTYNYGISEYKRGNSFFGMFVNSREIYSGISESSALEGRRVLTAPDGYTFHVADEDVPSGKDPVVGVVLTCSDLTATKKFWQDLLGFTAVEASSDRAVRFSPQPGDAWLEFRKVVEGGVDHAKASGRIAFSVPATALPGIESKVKAAGGTILTPLISLDTPGKATVQVVILADPDGHEICFVGDEAYRELSLVDPASDEALKEAMKGDKSDEWFGKRGGKATEK